MNTEELEQLYEEYRQAKAKQGAYIRSWKNQPELFKQRWISLHKEAFTLTRQ